ncbi:tryptophan 7-halogenase [Sphingomonas sp. KR1UV-12]|uniref:Tryptophan 7-halogenase n=1 Tax=Sphingomonas aurea TaxID=3063994 RepID=A0ABT9EIE6_9SPHN|nr:tryptophan halogenase family protein [Sphingomonas sp. KR1UV-12]MDP1026733.1 tryptophan 7-halogenase [Sphingomonas sp. KR1UV-12]
MNQTRQYPGAQHVVIVGGGTAGWMAAALIARFRTPAQARVTLIESDAIGTIGVGEATVPLIQHLNSVLGLHEPDFVAATQGSFKLGIEFVDWGRVGNRHFHGFGDYGADIDGVAPHHHWLRLRREGLDAPIGAWSMAWAAAGRDRFAPPQAMKGPAAAFKHAYHFDAGLYAQLLRRHAEGKGVQRIEGRIAGVTRDGESGDVTTLVLDGDREVTGDLFVDCSGFASLLLGQALAVPFVDWSHWLPCDRAMAVGSRRAGRLTPFTRATARAAGWQWRIPLQHRTGNGMVYASSQISDDEAAATLLAGLDGEALGDPRPLRFTTGRRARFWERNVIGIGLAAGFMEPLESTSIQLIQTGLARLIELLPSGSADPAIAAEYNRQTIGEYERIRDFLIAHYALSSRDEPLWRQCRAMALPDTLAHKLATWDACARVPLYDLESHQEPSWVAILLGQERVPRGIDATADTADPQVLAKLFADRRALLARAAESMPAHDLFVERTCRALAA